MQVIVPVAKKGENILMNKRFLTIFLLILIAIVIFIGLFRNEILKVFYPLKYAENVENYAKSYNIEESLIFALIKAESNFDEKAVSHKDALGLMQIMEETAIDVAKKYDININMDNAKKDILDTDNNINIGTKYLAVLLEKYHNVEVAVAAYNAGIGTVDKWIEQGIIKADGTDIENIPYKETNNYVRKILVNYKMYKELYYN